MKHRMYLFTKKGATIHFRSPKLFEIECKGNEEVYTDQ